MRRLFQCGMVALLAAQSLSAQEAPAPEEPDFFFLTGGPYTQLKNSFQIIWANQVFRDRSPAPLPVEQRNFVGAGRFEWGFTDRLEFDLEFGYLRLRERAGGVSTVSVQGADDTMLGVRYRLLREDATPLTLTLGPQVILPSASRQQGLGSGEVSYAVDLTLAHDFGGPVFTAASVNLSFTPSVPDPTPGSTQGFDLSAVEWGAALGYRVLECNTPAGSRHDIHVHLELGGSRSEELMPGGRQRATEVLVAPAIRYGFLTARKVLSEVGIAFPLGLNGAAPDWGVILQLQFEYPF